MAGDKLSNPEIITLGDLIGIILRRKVLFMAVIAIFAVMGGLIALLKTPKYQFTQMIVPAQINSVTSNHLTPQAQSLQSSKDIDVMLKNTIVPAVIATLKKQGGGFCFCRYKFRVNYPWQ